MADEIDPPEQDNYIVNNIKERKSFMDSDRRILNLFSVTKIVYSLIFCYRFGLIIFGINL